MRENVSLQHPRHRFLCWVALCRTTDPSIPIENRRKCPFQWCEYTSGSSDGVELLNHVSSCPRLSEGQYICPYHHKPEPFMRPQKRSRLFKPARRHFLKHAFTAIYRLGSKSLQKAMHPARLNVIHHDRRHSKKRRYDDEFPTIAPPTRAEKHDAAFRGAELDSTAIKSAFAPVLSDSTVPAELSGRRTRVFEVEGILPIVVEPPRAELASKRFSTASSESALVTNPSVSSASSPVSPVTSEQFFSSKGFDSPISPADVSHFLQWSDAQGRHQNSLPVGVSTSAVDSQAHASPWPPASARSQSLWASVGARAALRSCPNIRIDTSCANNRRIDNDLSPESSRDHLGNTPSPLQIESQIQSRVKLVDELRGLFNTTFKISYSKLFQPPPCLTAMGFESYQSAADMFETAWQAVASITHGVLPDTMSEIFALAHLAYACALAVQETDLVDQLPHIFEDLTLWSHAISKSQDRVRYLNLVQKLFDPQLLETGSSGLEDTLDADSSLLTPTPLHRASPGRSSSFPSWPSEGRPLNEMGQLSVPSFDITDHKKLHTSLKNGIIVRLCMQYLNSKQLPSLCRMLELTKPKLLNTLRRIRVTANSTKLSLVSITIPLSRRRPSATFTSLDGTLLTH